MTYIEDELLGEGESVEFIVNKTWFHYLPRIIPSYILIGAILGLILLNPQGGLSTDYRLYGILISIGVLLLSTLFFFIQHRSEEYVVTQNRVITKEGILRNDIYEIQKANIESIDIDQGILARIFSYGTIEINGTGNEDRKIINIAQPIEFRKAIGQ